MASLTASLDRQSYSLQKSYLHSFERGTFESVKPFRRRLNDEVLRGAPHHRQDNLEKTVKLLFMTFYVYRASQNSQARIQFLESC